MIYVFDNLETEPENSFSVSREFVSKGDSRDAAPFVPCSANR